jgi:ERF superfamily
LVTEPTDNGTDTLAAALVAAQAEMPAVGKDATNPHFKNKFVSLDNLIGETRQVLNRHGLAIVQFPTSNDLGAPVLRTILLHIGGERLEADTLLWPAGKSMQQLGAAITYARRYAWQSVLGVAAEEDTDGGPPPDQQPRAISDAERKRLFAIADENQVDQEALRDIIKGVTGVPSTKSITSETYAQIVGLVEAQNVPF